MSTSASIDGDVTGHHGNTGFQDYWVTKINKDNGTIIWEKSLGGSNEEQAGDISLASNGDYLINGIGLSSNGDVSSPNNGGRDYWMVRLTSNLTIAWDYTLGTSAEEWGISIIEAEPSCYIVTGNGSGKFIIGQGGYDFWTAKICEETLNAISIGEDNDVILFPNPMSKSSTLIFDDYINNYKVEIYNVYGKSISSLVNITGNMTKINTEELTSGIYLLTVVDESNRIVTTKKISISH